MINILGFKFESKEERRNREFAEFMAIKDKENRIAQIEDDRRWEQLLIRRAEQMFNEWMYSKGWLMDFTRHLDIRYIHNDKYSRWAKNEDSKAFKEAYFNKLKEEAISKATYPKWFDDYYKEHRIKYKDNPYVHDEWFVLWHGIAGTMNNAERELVRRKYFS